MLVSHACDTQGEKPHMHGFLRQHTPVHTQSICTCVCFYTYACLYDYISYLASQLFTFQLKLYYNTTILVSLFFPYKALAAHQGVEDEIAEEVESIRLILQLTTSYLTEIFLLPEVDRALYKMLGKVPSLMCMLTTQMLQFLRIGIMQTTALLHHACAANGMDLLSIPSQL